MSPDRAEQAQATEGGNVRTHTRTYTSYFDSDQVDATVGAAHRSLESDFESRREHMRDSEARAIESRLAFLRACWMLLLEGPDS